MDILLCGHHFRRSEQFLQRLGVVTITPDGVFGGDRRRALVATID